MVKKLRITKGKSARKGSKKPSKRAKQAKTERLAKREPSKTGDLGRASPTATAPTPTSSVSDLPNERPIFSIELDNIDGETTIGDLIVVFPRTRDVLMKNGLRFDAEDAGYIYMNLNVFSALHGLKLNSLIQELVVASREVAGQPSGPPFPQIAAPPTA